MIKSLTPACDSSESDDDLDKAFQPLNFILLIVICSWVTLGEPTEREKQVVQAKSYISDSFDYSHEFQMVKTHDLREYREFDRTITPKIGDNIDHLEQAK